MRQAFYLFLGVFVLLFSSCEQGNYQQTTESGDSLAIEEPVLIYSRERHFENIKQYTFGGENSEAYWSFDHKSLVFQSNFQDWGIDCEQIYTINLETPLKEGDQAPLVSTGLGRTTGSYYYPDGKSILYGSTHLAGENCPDSPPFVGGKYVWGIYPGFDIFQTDLSGTIISQLTDAPGYDAEARISPKGDKIVFTSMRSGDLELWTMDLDGSNLNQITNALGYDGGASFSPDGSKLVFRASRPQTEEEILEYKELLSQGLVQPTAMELFICNVDGSDLNQITRLGGANWAPSFHPSGQRIIFSTNHHTASGRQFNLFMVDLNGENLEQITFDENFDAFPIFSGNGKKLLFSSNRNNGGTRDTNVFIADWKE